MNLKVAYIAGGIVSASRRNKVSAVEPTSERRSREKNGERDFGSAWLLAAPPPKLYFVRAIPPATQG